MGSEKRISNSQSRPRSRPLRSPGPSGYVVENFDEATSAGYGNLDGRKLTPQKAIKLHCLACHGGHEFSWRMADGSVEEPSRPHADVKTCPCKTCWLYPFRTGRNPFTKRKGNPVWRKNEEAER